MLDAKTRPMAKPLTERQLQIYTWIYGQTRSTGVQPSYREIGSHFEIGSPNAIAGHIHAIIRAGYATYPPNSKRSLWFLRRPDGSPFKGFRD